MEISKYNQVYKEIDNGISLVCLMDYLINNVEDLDKYEILLILNKYTLVNK